MCGIVALVSRKNISEILGRMAHAQRHRGPDHDGFFKKIVGNYNLGFGHQRLSILDLSTAGQQPFKTRSGRFIGVFNGEIYNHEELRIKFNLRELKSNSDTEIAFELIEKIGIYKGSSEFNGMWSIVIFDTLENKLFLSRDRVGKKPLHIHIKSDELIIASEISTYKEVGLQNFSVNEKNIANFLTHSQLHTDDETWLKDIKQFPAGHVAEINLNHSKIVINKLRCFWDLNKIIKQNNAQIKNDCEYTRHLIEDAIKIRLKSDVNMAVALSGGLDSSIIAASTVRMKNLLDTNVATFSVLNRESVHDESKFVDVLASFLDTPVNEISLGISDNNLITILSECLEHSDGPVPSFAPALFMEMMKQVKSAGYKVILTGQGADEVFAGYRKYSIFYILQCIKNHQFLRSMQHLFFQGINGAAFSNFSYAEAKRYLTVSENNILGEKAVASRKKLEIINRSNLKQSRIQDIKRFSVPYLCHYEDRMSMSQSIEVRSPFLDYRVIEHGLQISNHEILKRGWTKYPLRKAFADQLPGAITWRKDKKGFVNPQDEWLQGSLKDILIDVANNSNSSIYQNGWVDKVAYNKLVQRYLAGSKTIWFREVFAPLSLELWYNSFFKDQN